MILIIRLCLHYLTVAVLVVCDSFADYRFMQRIHRVAAKTNTFDMFKTPEVISIPVIFGACGNFSIKCWAELVYSACWIKSTVERRGDRRHPRPALTASKLVLVGDLICSGTWQASVNSDSISSAFCSRTADTSNIPLNERISDAVCAVYFS